MTDRFLVHFKTKGPGFFQLAWRPISSVLLPAWTAASNIVTLAECAVSCSQNLELLRGSFVIVVQSMLGKVLQPLERALVLSWHRSKGFTGVEIPHPKMPI